MFASRAIQQRRNASARPLQSHLLHSFAGTLDTVTRAALSAAIADGVAAGTTTSSVTVEVLRKLS